MYPADEVSVKAWPQIPFKYKIQRNSQNVPDWARTLPNVFVSIKSTNFFEFFSDVSALENVHALDLSGCLNVSDVSALGNVHTLNLRSCRNVSDISALGNVHTLNLSNFANVSDVSALGNVHTLDLRRCVILSDVSALRNVKHLTLPNGDVEKRE